MNTPQNFPTAICAYAKCGKTFVQNNPTKIHCSDSCRVRKCTSRKKESTPLSVVASALQPALPSHASLPDFITEIKALSNQIHDAKARSSDEITFTGVLESLMANFTAKFLERLLLGDPVNDKLDYLIRQVQQLNTKHNQQQVPAMGSMPVMGKINKPTAISSMKVQVQKHSTNNSLGMEAMPWPDDLLM